MSRCSPTQVLALLIGAVAATTIAGCGGCGSGSAPTGSASASASAPASASAAPSPAGPDREPGSFPEPVYPRTNDPPDPLAVSLCDALHVLPAKRKAECCKAGPGLTMVSECARTLSYALRSKAISVDPSSVQGCADAMAKAHEGCDWVTPLSSPVPAACLGIIKGTVKEDEPCRSSMECEDGLRCHGVAASDTGRCGKPLGVGACARGIDMLASYTRQIDAERRHPECAGHCNGRRCEPDIALGGECRTSNECGADRHCINKKCSDIALPPAGEPCVQGACGGGARCVAGQCISPKKAGEPCTDEAECAGTCDKAPGAPTGKCALLCAAKIPGSR